MDTRRPDSDPIDRQQHEIHPAARAGAWRRRGWRISLLCALFAVLSGAASAAEPSEPAPAEVPAPLGASDASLRERFDASLRPVKVERPRSVFEQIAPPPAPTPPAGDASGDEAGRSDAPVQERLGRPASGEVRRVEYDLAEGRVYRVRWRLAERFERPILDGVATRLAQRLGPPDYDQTLRAELDSGRADLRRIGWTSSGRALEVRQLHPFTGGPVFLSLADVDAMQRIVDARGVPLPPPETTGSWWRRSQRLPELLSDAEREALVAAVDALVAKLAETSR